jgi:predicted phage gp36 major capsid-like protein
VLPPLTLLSRLLLLATNPQLRGVRQVALLSGGELRLGDARVCARAPRRAAAASRCACAACRPLRHAPAARNAAAAAAAVPLLLHAASARVRACAGVLLMSPLLRSLTRNISEDSVIAMIAGLCILHLFLYDYK